MPGPEIISEPTALVLSDLTQTTEMTDTKSLSLTHTPEEYQDWALHLKDRVSVFMHEFGNHPADFISLMQSITQDKNALSLIDKHQCDADLADLVDLLNQLQLFCHKLISAEQHRKGELDTFAWYEKAFAKKSDLKILDSHRNKIKEIGESIKTLSVEIQKILELIAKILTKYHFDSNFTVALNNSKPSTPIVAAHSAITTVGKGLNSASNIASTVISGVTTTASFAAHVAGNVLEKTLLNEPASSFTSERVIPQSSQDEGKSKSPFAQKLRTHESLRAVAQAAKFSESDQGIFDELTEKKKPKAASSNPGTGFFAKHPTLSRLLQWTKEFLQSIHLLSKENVRKRSYSTSDLHSDIQPTAAEKRKRRHSM